MPSCRPLSLLIGLSTLGESDFKDEVVSSAIFSATEYGGGATSGIGSSLLPPTWEITWSVFCWPDLFFAAFF
jgi:hypothetical protein